MKVGVRNQLGAEVVEIKKGDIMCKVKVALKDGNGLHMSSVMTSDSLQEMDLKVGDSVYVVTKAVNVLLAKD